MEFIGRKKELESLKELLHKKTASLVVIRGRRRIGKSRLAEEFAKSFPKSYILSGIPPNEETTAAGQREEFLRQLQQYKLPVYRSDDWGNMFYDLSQSAKTEKIIIVFDEITWMGSEDPTFLPKLKTAWDLYFKKNPKLIMVLSGSNSTWIQKNILNSTGFFGRVSLRLLLEELSLPECNQQKIGMDIIKEVQEKCKALQLPKGFSYRPILIHVNGVDEEVEDAGFFANIVDFSVFLD